MRLTAGIVFPVDAVKMGEVSVPLTRERQMRRRIGRAACILPAVMVVLVAISVIKGHIDDIAFSAVLAVLYAFLGLSLARAAVQVGRRPEPSLVLSGDHATIDYSAYEAPIVITRDAVHSIRLAEFRHFNLFRPHRLDRFGEGELPRGGWYVRDLYLHQRGARPNLLVVLAPPQQLPPRVSVGYQQLFRSRPTEYAARALVMRVADIGEARDPLAAWGGYKMVDHLPADVMPYILQEHPMLRTGD